MQDTFQNIKESLAACREYVTDDELSEAARNLVSFFEVLIQIDSDQKDKRDENYRSEHSIHQAR